jgi:RimJ/RimL family protein N-acetyltransferase
LAKFSKKGIGTKILDKLLKLGFEKFHFHRIGAEVLENNKNSQKFFKKMNFT